MTLSLDEAIALRHLADAGDRSGHTPARRAVDAVCDRIRTRFRRRADWPGLTRGEQLVFTLGYTLDAEVQNGGIHQYLTNSSGDTAEDVKAYLAEVGATDLLAFFAELSALFPGGVISPDRDAREAVLWPSDEAERYALFARIEAVEGRYRRLWDGLFERIMDYVEGHRSEFALPAAAATTPSAG